MGEGPKVRVSRGIEANGSGRGTSCEGILMVVMVMVGNWEFRRLEG